MPEPGSQASPNRLPPPVQAFGIRPPSAHTWLPPSRSRLTGELVGRVQQNRSRSSDEPVRGCLRISSWLRPRLWREDHLSPASRGRSLARVGR